MKLSSISPAGPTPAPCAAIPSIIDFSAASAVFYPFISPVPKLSPPVASEEKVARQTFDTRWNLPREVLAALKEIARQRDSALKTGETNPNPPDQLSFWPLAYPLLNGEQHTDMPMNTMELTVPETTAPQTERTLEMPLGLLGFESAKQYELLFSPEEEPFMWLQMRDTPNYSFLVVSPFCILPEYQPDLTQEDVAFLKVADPEDACVLNIVTMHDDGRATVNLKGPVVINRQTWVGKQVILANASDYALQHPLPLPA